jgi:hypothetical protein
MQRNAYGPSKRAAACISLKDGAEIAKAFKDLSAEASKEREAERATWRVRRSVVLSSLLDF